MKIVSEKKFRSQPKVNEPSDMVRVTLDCTLREWRKFKRLLVNAPVAKLDKAPDF